MLAPNRKELDENSLKIIDKIPRIINLCARNEESLNQLFDFIENNPNKITRDFLALITDTMKVKPSLTSAGFPNRGFENLKLNFFFAAFQQKNNYTKNDLLIIRFNDYKENQWIE